MTLALGAVCVLALVASAAAPRTTLLVHPDEFTDRWIDRAVSIGLTSLEIHPTGGTNAAASLTALLGDLETPAFRARIDRARAKGLEIGYEFHAAGWLLPRDLFGEHPEYFRMDRDGKRCRDINFCLSSAEGMDLVAKRAVELAGRLYGSSHRYFFWMDDVPDGVCHCEKCRGYSASDQQLLFVNRVLAELRKTIPDAQLCYLAYLGGINPPEKVTPSEGVFLEYAPIKRDPKRPLAVQKNADVAPLKALVAKFGARDARVLEYWFDNSLLSKWTKPPKRFVPPADVVREDIAYYRALGFSDLASFACFLGDDYEKLWGVPDVSAFARGFHSSLGGFDRTDFTWSVADGRFRFAFTVRDATVSPVRGFKTKRDLERGDRVEVFFCPTADMKTAYRCAEIDPLGRVLDYACTFPRQFDYDWSFKTLDCRTARTADGYAVEGSVSVDELRDLGIDLARFWLGAFRADFDEKENLVAWYSQLPPGPGEADFHRPCMVGEVMGEAAIAPVGTASAGEIWRSQPLGEVRLGGEFGRRLEMTVTNNFLKIDRSEFLTPFVEKKTREGYVALGKFIDTAVSLAKQTGRADVRAIKEEAVATLLRHQQADGYLGALAPAGRLWNLWDAHEVAYLIYGLMSDWEEFGNKAALDGARRAADWVIANWHTMPKDWQTSFVNEPMYTIGQCRAFLRLFAATHERRYLDFVLKERRLAELDTPIFCGRAAMMWGHAYTYLENCLAQMMLWRTNPDPKLLRSTERAFDFMLNRNGAVVTGAAGIAECWTDSQDGDGDVGETCTTVYELFCADEQIRLGLGDAARLGDFMERTIWNALFGAQSKDGRRIRYYTSLLGHRTYYDGDKYCCPNNYRRLIPHLGQFALYAGEKAVLANLYAPLETTVAVGGTRVGVRETTDYPTDETVTFAIDPEKPVEFALNLRIPAWCTNAAVTVNGRPTGDGLRSGRLFALNRTWTRGDRVTLTLPMTLRVVGGRERQAGRVALLRGPLVYAFDPAAVARQSDGRVKEVFSRHPFEVQAMMQVDPRRLKVVRDDTVRPGGTAVEAEVSYEPFSVGVTPKWGMTRVKFTEYADPDATVTYFRTPDIKRDACADELFK